jgi:Tfp pilus assembly protein PilO
VSPRSRRRSWIALGGLAALNAIVFAAYTFPKRLEERSVNERIVSLKAEVERERMVVGRLRRRAETLQANAADVKRFYDGLGTRSLLLSVLEELQRTSTQLGLKVGRRSYEPNQVKGLPLTRYAITMPVTGSYRQLTAFLDRMEGSSHFLTVDQVNLRKRVAAGEADLDVAMSAYVRSSPGARADDAP